jgi:hypothetical protein
LTRNELFHWLLINFFCLIAHESTSETLLDQIDAELLLELLKNSNVVVTSELNLYNFLKKWMHRNLEKSQQHDLPSDIPLLSTAAGDKYLRIFQYLRLLPLLSFTKSIRSIFDDNIFPLDHLNKTLAMMHIRILKNSELIVDEPKNQFRIAKRFEKNVEQTFQTEFFCCGVVLKFKFTAKQLSVIPQRADNCKLSYQGRLNAKIRFTLYGSLLRDQCRFTTEAMEPTTIELTYGKEKVIANWRKVVTFPCTLSGEIVIGEKIVEVE